MTSLHHKKTWDLVPIPSNKKSVGCRWVYIIKYRPDGTVDCSKASLVAKATHKLMEWIMLKHTLWLLNCFCNWYSFL